MDEFESICNPSTVTLHLPLETPLPNPTLPRIRIIFRIPNILPHIFVTEEYNS